MKNIIIIVLLFGTSCNRNDGKKNVDIFFHQEIQRLTLQLNENLNIAVAAYDSSIKIVQNDNDVNRAELLYGDTILSIWKLMQFDVDSINELCDTYRIDSASYEDIFKKIEFNKVHNKSIELEKLGVTFELKK